MNSLKAEILLIF